MNENLIEQYKRDMLNMYRNRGIMPTAAAMPEAGQNTDQADEQKGSIVAIVSSLRGLYPVKGAKVTIFIGNYNEMQVLDTAYTDESGRTRPFLLPIPDKSISLDENSRATPYSSYNMEVKAEGYVDNIHLNIPVFSGVTSLQRSNMLLLETSGEDKSPQIFNESEDYEL